VNGPLPLVLIVDDNADDVAVYSRWLRTLRQDEFQVETALSLESALACCAIATPDCIVLDYDLREMTGLEVIGELEARNIRAPIVAITGHSSEQVAVEFLRGGASDYLIKSRMSPADLRTAVIAQLAKAAIRNAERERDRLIERITLATDAAQVGIWDFDISTDTLVWDSIMFVLYGLSAANFDPTYRAWFAAIHPEDRERVERTFAIAQSAATGTPFGTEFRVVWPTGDVHNIQAMARVVCDDAGRAVRMIGTNWDITEVRNLAEQLRSETDRLVEVKELAEETSRAKSAFLANMSHEIRTPMNGVIGLTTLLLDTELTPSQRQHVMLLADVGRSLLAIINDILDLSKVEAGKIDLESIPLAPTGLVEGALSIVQGEASAKGLTVGMDIAPDVPAWVSGDPTRLRQILLNLLTNALKFTDNGRVAVAVRREPGAPNMLRFAVSDTGIGIAADRRELLFKQFSQVDRSIARTHGGTGLGLAISKRLAEAMMGSIGVESELGGGSTFWFTAALPPAESPANSLSSPSLGKPVASATRRILVADDNVTNRIVVCGMLTGDGHTVVQADNGAQALAALGATSFDLVLMDVQMPIMDGLDATRRLRALGGRAGETPVVALSAGVLPEQIAQCLSAGMNDHLAKPIDRHALRRIVASWSSAGDGATRSLDITALLEQCDGDDEAVFAIVTSAVESIQAGMATIDAALDARDLDALIRGAHHLRGTFGDLRAIRLLELAARIECTPRADFWTLVPGLLAALQGGVAALSGDIEMYARTRAAELNPPPAATRLTEI
jgi:signal transduction histidine kinase/DNA-binding NarL/FixJ family response regulator